MGRITRRLIDQSEFYAAGIQFGRSRERSIMPRRTTTVTLWIVLLLHAWPAPLCYGRRAQPEHWLRDGELGPTPERVSDALPLSDQNDTGNWLAYEPMTDEFDGETLDPNRWWPKNPGWLGRQPAYFWPGNVEVADGSLHLTMRKQEVPEMPKDRGYHTYTSAAVQSKARVLYGYFEIKARAMKSHGSSSFWFYYSTPEQWTEIDVFEIGGGSPGFERKYNMNAHVFRTPTETEHWSSHGEWTAPWNLADDYHVYGLEWDEERIQWYVDGILVRWLENTHWRQPLTLNFDSETMPTWFGLPNDGDLPSTYDIDYVRAWKRPDSPETVQRLNRITEQMKSVFGENPGMIEHTMKVYGYARDIQHVEGGDAFTIAAAALLHDIGIPKAKQVHGSSAGPYQEMEGPPIARQILTDLGVEPEKIDPICRIIANHHSANDKDTIGTIEFQTVWDADWMVNFPARHRNIPDKERQRIIEETFRTLHGRHIARNLFLK